MTAPLRQATFDEDNAEYAAFLEKFKPKKTTDDCYTPPNVYDAVRTWVFRRYALPPETEIVRPFYEYPPEVVTSASLGYLAVHGTCFKVRRGDCTFIRAMDSQRDAGKAIFGGGLLLTERAAAERAAAERAAARRWSISERERAIQAMMARGASA